MRSHGIMSSYNTYLYQKDRAAYSPGAESILFRVSDVNNRDAPDH